MVLARPLGQGSLQLIWIGRQQARASHGAPFRRDHARCKGRLLTSGLLCDMVRPVERQEPMQCQSASALG